MKKLIALVIVLFLMTMTLTGCPPQEGDYLTTGAAVAGPEYIGADAGGNALFL